MLHVQNLKIANLLAYPVTEQNATGVIIMTTTNEIEANVFAIYSEEHKGWWLGNHKSIYDIIFTRDLRNIRTFKTMHQAVDYLRHVRKFCPTAKLVNLHMTATSKEVTDDN